MSVTSTAVQTWAWTWSRPRCRRTASSRWWWWCGSFLPASPAGSGSSCCPCTARGFSGEKTKKTDVRCQDEVDSWKSETELRWTQLLPRPELRWRSPAPTEICWCSWPRPAPPPPLRSYSPVQTINSRRYQFPNSQNTPLNQIWNQFVSWLDLLAAGKVDQVELPRQLLLRLDVLLLDVDEEDAVAAGAVLVHVCKIRISFKVARSRNHECH